jgi:hypothetical protein
VANARKSDDRNADFDVEIVGAIRPDPHARPDIAVDGTTPVEIHQHAAAVGSQDIGVVLPSKLRLIVRSDVIRHALQPEWNALCHTSHNPRPF